MSLGRPDLYTYTPLSPSQIRILILQPSDDDAAPLCCQLLEVGLDSETSYEALSWTWGDPARTDELIVDHKSIVRISSNLRSALLRLRLRSEPRRLWVDAICINQPDEAEKARQIPIMADIYRGAYAVMVWLGESGADHFIALNNFAAQRPGTVPESEIKSALSAVVAMPWFTRRWVVQEFALNANVTFRCGVSKIPLTRLQQIFFQLKDEEQNELTNLKALISLWDATVRRPDPERTKIWNLLQESSDSECMDGRDRIYALTALASDVSANANESTRKEVDGGKIEVNISYTKTVDQMYEDFAVACIDSGLISIWEILKQTSLRSNGGLGRGNSWIPDWRMPVLRQPLELSERAGVLRLSLEQDQITHSVSWETQCVGLDWRPGSKSAMDTVRNLSDQFPPQNCSSKITNWLQNTWVKLVSSNESWTRSELLGCFLLQFVDVLVAGDRKFWHTHVLRCLPLMKTDFSLRFILNDYVDDGRMSWISPYIRHAQRFYMAWVERFSALIFPLDDALEPFYDKVWDILRNRIIFFKKSSESLYCMSVMGLGPAHTQIGDNILFRRNDPFHGSQPDPRSYLLRRKVGEETEQHLQASVSGDFPEIRGQLVADTYHFVGDCYFSWTCRDWDENIPFDESCSRRIRLE